MIKNTNEILAEKLAKVKGILREFVKSVLDEPKEGQLTINSIEKLLGVSILSIIRTMLDMSGALLSNVVATKNDEYCSCGKKLT